MKPKPQTQAALLAEIELLQARLAEAEGTLQAIHEGAVDGLVVQTGAGPGCSRCKARIPPTACWSRP